MLELAVELAPCELFMPGLLSGPWPAGGPPPGCERCANAGAAKASASTVTMARMRRFTVFLLVEVLGGWRDTQASYLCEPRIVLMVLGCAYRNRGCFYV